MPNPYQDLENEAFVTELIKQLTGVYASAKDEIVALLAKSSLTGFQEDRLKTLMAQVRGVVDKLDAVAADFASASIPKAYAAGQNIAAKVLKDIGEKAVPDFGARIHTQAVKVIAEQMAIDALEKNGTIVSNVNRALLRTKQTTLTEQQINQQIAQGLIGGEPRRITSKRIADQLAQELGEGKLVTAGSKQFTPEDYAELLARTRTREAVTNGIIISAQQVGIDLFEVSVHDNPCPVCRAYQGRVFSVSGESELFPKLEIRPPFHPRCKHVLVPVTESHLRRKGLLDAKVKLSNDASIEVVDNASYMKFLEDNPQKKGRLLPPIKAGGPYVDNSDSDAFREAFPERVAFQSKGLSRKQKTAIGRYIGKPDAYNEINTALRAGTTTKDAETLRSAFNSGVTRMPENTTLYRGVGFSKLEDLGRELNASLESGSIVGTVLTDKAYLSTSFNRGNSEVFALWDRDSSFTLSMLFKIEAPAGTDFLYGNTKELEAILPAGRSLFIKEVKKIGKTSRYEILAQLLET